MATRRSGLGRGLGALIPGSDSSRTQTEQGNKKVVDVTDNKVLNAPAELIQDGSEVIDLRAEGGMILEVDIEKVRPNSFQPRKSFDVDALQPLADSIKELGVLQPLLVRSVPDVSGEYELIAGERRLRASKLADLKTVPVIVRDREDIVSLQEALVENLHRKDLNAIDEASAYRQLMDDFKMTHDDVAKKVGKSRTSVSNSLRLLQLQPKVQKMVIEEKISSGHARALLSVDDQAFQLQLAEKVVKDSLSVRGVEDVVRTRNELDKPHTSERAKSKTRSVSSVSAPILEWQERIKTSLDTRVAVSNTSKNGKITIEFADLDDLERIGAIIEAGSDFGEDDE